VRNEGTQICLVNPRRQLLVSRRASTLREFPGYVQFPGGRLEAGESKYDGARRELDEELGILNIHTFGPWIDLFSNTFNPPGREPYVLHSFVLLVPTLVWPYPNPEPEKCSDWYWADWLWLVYQPDLMDGMKETLDWLTTEYWEDP
jgi:8-oxo-dGTP pyrophosphatase MutT (NUDIX family)